MYDVIEGRCLVCNVKSGACKRSAEEELVKLNRQTCEVLPTEHICEVNFGLILHHMKLIRHLNSVLL